MGRTITLNGSWLVFNNYSFKRNEKIWKAKEDTLKRFTIVEIIKPKYSWCYVTLPKYSWCYVTLAYTTWIFSNAIVKKKCKLQIQTHGKRGTRKAYAFCRVTLIFWKFCKMINQWSINPYCFHSKFTCKR